MSSSTLETLQFDNSCLSKLPLDPNPQNYVRTVPGACFSRVTPTPVKNPRLVATSREALQWIGLDEAQVNRPEFVEYFAGNKVLPGSEPAAHCYCGHQFGNFAGQLGDGRAMYLGEVINPQGQRVEIQFKGAGKTPYSREADGRAVLRSSIREFLCSEAMFHLGVPTTRTCPSYERSLPSMRGGRKSRSSTRLKGRGRQTQRHGTRGCRYTAHGWIAWPPSMQGPIWPSWTNVDVPLWMLPTPNSSSATIWPRPPSRRRRRETSARCTGSLTWCASPSARARPSPTRTTTPSPPTGHPAYV
eukprot:TRINITY_DN5950_c0_g1_i1.p1 TRINITY_DN5950_c0_g1~~TRINITY_DN5950_c0_g1_i1.p1  ORF type:complete len:323 (-),score=10.22 TRINITY_DN5950_c0_g1_i1:44-946(-)